MAYNDKKIAWTNRTNAYVRINRLQYGYILHSNMSIWMDTSIHASITAVNEKKRLPVHTYTYTNPHENWLDLYIYFVQKSG